MAEPATTERPASGRESGKATRYEDDLYTWVQEQVALLRGGQLSRLDAENIAEELSDVGSEQYNRLEGALEVLLMHMLKWDQQPGRRSRSWRLTIEEQRLRVEAQLRKNPGLKSRIPEAIADGFRLGRVRAAREMKVEPEALPATCPYSWDEILNRAFNDAPRP